MKTVEFLSDKVQIRSNLAGGNSTVTLHVGEYSLEDLKEVLTIPQETNVKITMSWE